MSPWTLHRPRVSVVLGAVILLAACSNGSGSGNQGSQPPSCEGGDCARTCSDGKVACSGSCVDTQSDALNCGGCGHACAQGQPCVGGSCACNGGLSRCEGDGGAAVCSDTSSDSANCGRCGNACAANESCIGGACVCAVGDLLCDSVCIDPMTSPLHCGAMNACDADGGSAGTACTTAQYCKTGSCTPCTMWTPLRRVPVAAGPYTLATADLNEDGKPDLLTAGSGNIDVLLGRGDGTFEPVQILVAAITYAYPSTSDIFLADFDGDGHLDLATGNSYPQIFYGYGDGTFDPNGHVVTGSAALQQLAVGDVNGDGKPDIVVVAPYLPGFQVYLNTGARTFSPLNAVTTEDPNMGPWPIGVSIADVNGDGKPDLLIGDDTGFTFIYNGASTVDVWLGKGDGTFALKTSYTLGTAEIDIAVADLNRDGKPDLVTADFNGVSVLLGKGDGTFAYETGLVSYGSPTHVVAEDVSGDGIPDLVISGNPPAYNFTLLEVRIGVGDGSFYPADAYQGGSAHVGVADVNGDRLMDLLAGNTETSDVIVYLGGKHHECK